MAAQRQRRVVVVGDDVLAFGRRQQVDLRFGGGGGGERRGARRVGVDAERGPQRAAAVAGEGGERVGLREGVGLAAMRAAARRARSCASAKGASRRAVTIRSPAASGRPATSSRPRRTAGFERSAVDGSSVQFQSLTVTSIGRTSTPWFMRVAHDLRRRVEAEGLRVEQRRAERGRLVALQPRRHVHQQARSSRRGSRGSRIRRSPGSAGRSAPRTRPCSRAPACR